MCGLFGVFGPAIIGPDVKAFNEGLQTITLRGPHSTGIGWWDTKKPRLDYIKSADHAIDFLSRDDVTKRLESIKDPLILMGHVRWATRGVIKNANAHPFVHGNTMLAVNGTLTSINGMDTFNKYEVDSDAACWHLENKGLIPTLKNMNGPFALSWIDAEKKTFNLARNWGRDLFWAKHPYRKVWYYGSERRHLDWILHRNENNSDKYLNKGYEIKEVPTDSLVRFSFSDNVYDTEVVNLDKELYPNFRGRATVASPVDTTDGPATKIDTSSVCSMDTIAERIKQHRLFEQNKHHPTVVNLPKRKRSFEGNQGNPDVWMEKEYGVKIGDWIRVRLTEYTPYTNKRMELGKSVGEFDGVDSPDVFINAHSIDLNKKPFEGKFIPGYYACKVSALSWVPDMESYAIHINGYDLMKNHPDAVEPSRINTFVPPFVPDRGILQEAAPQGPVSKAPVGMTVKEFNNLSEGGCTLCHNNLHHHKKDKVYFIYKKHPLCLDCYVQYKHEAKMNDVAIANRVMNLVILAKEAKKENPQSSQMN